MSDTTFSFTSSVTPANEQVLEASGVPWGCVMSPAAGGATLFDGADSAPHQYTVSRCAACGAYINRHCTWGTGWCARARAPWSAR